MMEEIEKVKEYFGKLLEEQLERVERLKKNRGVVNYRCCCLVRILL